MYRKIQQILKQSKRKMKMCKDYKLFKFFQLGVFIVPVDDEGSSFTLNVEAVACVNIAKGKVAFITKNHPIGKTTPDQFVEIAKQFYEAYGEEFHVWMQDFLRAIYQTPGASELDELENALKAEVERKDWSFGEIGFIITEDI